MKIKQSIADMKSTIHKLMQGKPAYRTGRHSIGFVPTMGVLHEGHRSLIRRARRENDHVVVSLFVNPLQFGPKEDFKRYPRTLKQDLTLLKQEPLAILFNPSPSDLFPPPSPPPLPPPPPPTPPSRPPPP